ncbi:MAG: hypothetical protein MN733_42230 [Nitrososphaera sp.]|nr:hypothetical protein [Nitrososphaera sp.]
MKNFIIGLLLFAGCDCGNNRESIEDTGWSITSVAGRNFDLNVKVIKDKAGNEYIVVWNGWGLAVTKK